MDISERWVRVFPRKLLDSSSKKVSRLGDIVLKVSQKAFQCADRYPYEGYE